MFSYVDGFVRNTDVCVCVCVVICFNLEIILFGGLLPGFCIVVSLNQPICICVECPILNRVPLCRLYPLMTSLCSSASTPPSFLFCLLLSLFVSTYILLFFYSPMCTPSLFYICLNLPMYMFISLLCWLYYAFNTSVSCYLLTLMLHHLSFPPLFLHSSPLQWLDCNSWSLSSFSPVCLLLEGTVRAPAGRLAVVKAAQTATWSAWSHDPGAAPNPTAPTAPCGHRSLRLAASLASPSLPEGIALAATTAHREAAEALALVRTVEESERKISH